MSDVNSVSLLDLLPSNLKQDSQVVNAAKSIDQEMRKLNEAIENLIVLPRIHQLDNDMVDILAKQFNTPLYDTSLPLDVKREMVKNSISLHKQKGTSYSVESGLSSVFGKANVKEWFEYNGNPFFFKVIVDINNTVMDTNYFKLAREIIEKTKNARSRVEKISYAMEKSQGMHIGSIARVGKITTITPSTEVTINVSSNHQMFTGTYVRTVKKVTINGGT